MSDNTKYESFNVMSSTDYNNMIKINSMQKFKKRKYNCIRIFAEQYITLNFSLLFIITILFCVLMGQAIVYKKSKQRLKEANLTRNIVLNDYYAIQNERIKEESTNDKLNEEVLKLQSDIKDYENKIQKQNEELSVLTSSNANRFELTSAQIEIVNSFLSSYHQLLSNLCYSSSIHGNDPKIFLSKCQSISPTVTIYHSQYNEKVFHFGGYTTLKWDSSIINDNDISIGDNTFLFSINNNKKFPFDAGRCSFPIMKTAFTFPSFGNSDLYCTVNKCNSSFPRCFSGAVSCRDFLPLDIMYISSVDVFTVEPIL